MPVVTDLSMEAQYFKSQLYLMRNLMTAVKPTTINYSGSRNLNEKFRVDQSPVPSCDSC